MMRGPSRDPFDEGELAEQPPLSVAGRARRAAIRCELEAAVVEAAHHRSLGRRVSGGLLLATGAAVVALALRGTPASTGRGEMTEAPRADAPSAPFQRLAHVRFDVVSSPTRSVKLVEARAATRLEGVLAAPAWRTAASVEVDDAELIELLAQAGRPAGLVRVEGRAILSTELAAVLGAPSE